MPRPGATVTMWTLKRNPVMRKQLNIQVLLTGNEVMAGDTIDSNSAYMAQVLAEHGLKLSRKVTVNDDETQLLSELEHMAQTADVILMNGGLGPTVDDLTAQVLATLSDQPLSINADAKAQLEAWCKRRGQPLNEANRKQMLMPEGSSIIPNATGSAPGIDLRFRQTRIFATPGVPSEMRAMMPLILERIQSEWRLTSQTHVLRLQTFGIGESNAQQLITHSRFEWPGSVDLGFRASAPQMEVKLTIQDAQFKSDQLACADQIHSLFGDHVIGEGDSTLAQTVVQLLAARGQSITTAESCTGGMIASQITQVAGASRVFKAGFVTYSNDMKSRMIGVDPVALEQHGAVSEPVVRAMAAGALEVSGADYAIAVSGIAGPDGGSPEKPVGTVWIAYGTAADLRSLQLVWPVPRQLFQTMITACTLDLVRRQLLDIKQHCRYVEQRSSSPTSIV